VDLSRLLHPRTVAVVGATERPGAYAAQTLQNLEVAGYAGEVWGVNPNRTSVFGRPCFPSLSDCPTPPDAVVVAIPATGVAAVVEEAGALGCGGAVVYGAGFGEVESGAALEAELAAAAAAHDLPLCGPNGNGIVALHERAALWGDALQPFEAGRVALVSQSGNFAVNALNARRGLRLHTVISCGNSVMVDPAEWVAELAGDDGVGAIALYLEGDGDGALLCEALARCVEQGVGVAVLKVGSSAAGTAAAAAHTGALAGDQRIFRALVEEAGGAWAVDFHELLELAKGLAVPAVAAPAARALAAPTPDPAPAAPTPDPAPATPIPDPAPAALTPDPAPAAPTPAGPPGLAILTCSGGDSALAADECERIGLSLPGLAPQTRARLRELLPAPATVANPLDYTALIWGDAGRLRELIVACGADPAIDRVLVFYDQPEGLRGPTEESWAAARQGIHEGAAATAVPVMVASTLPELLDHAAAARFIEAGIPAVSGLRSALRVAAELDRSPADAARLREIGAAARSAAVPAGNGAAWLSEHDAKELLRERGLPVIEGRLVAHEEDAVTALGELGGHAVAKLAAASLQHKSDLGAVVLDIRDDAAMRAAHSQLMALEIADARVLVERMAEPGGELLVSARADGVVPSLVIAAGGLWTEVLSDLAVIPLPAAPERVERAIRAMRAAPLFTGGRGQPALDVAAAARLAAAAGAALLATGLRLLELNPVYVHEDGATVVDAVALGPA
jgi:acetate---CoA ligase (ADP-forming)